MLIVVHSGPALPLAGYHAAVGANGCGLGIFCWRGQMRKPGRSARRIAETNAELAAEPLGGTVTYPRAVDSYELGAGTPVGCYACLCALWPDISGTAGSG